MAAIPLPRTIVFVKKFRSDSIGAGDAAGQYLASSNHPPTPCIPCNEFQPVITSQSFSLHTY